MRNEPCLSSLAFSLGPYRLACALERGQLSLRVTATETRPHQLTLARLANVGSELQLAISASLSAHQQLQSPAAAESEEERLLDRVSGLESYVADLQRKLDGQGRPRKGGPSERRSSRGNLRERTEAMVLGSLREREDR